MYVCMYVCMYVMLLLVYAFHLGSGVITQYMLTAVKLGKELAMCDVLQLGQADARQLSTR